MKKVNWSPILISAPILIILHTLWRIYFSVWTAFSFYLIIGFIIIACISLLFDRFFILCVNAKAVWIIEAIVIICAILLFLNKCTEYYPAS